MDTKTSNLPVLSVAPDDSDYLIVLDTSDTSGGANGTLKKVLKSNLVSSFLTENDVKTLTNKTISAESNTISGLWWDELGRHTLTSSSTTMSIADLPVRKYLKVLITGIATGGTINLLVQFNGVTSSVYGRRTSPNGGVDVLNTASTSIIVSSSTASDVKMSSFEMLNINGQHKLGRWWGLGTNDSTTTCNRDEGAFEAQITDPITSIAISLSGAATGQYASGSEIVVLGHD